MSLKSFKSARIAFFKNLNEILSKLNYTPASLSMKLNNAAQMGGSVKSVVSAADISDWTNGKKVPSLYAMFKLCDYLRVGMDELLDTNFNIDTVVSRSFANQSAAAPKITLVAPVTPITKTRTVTLPPAPVPCMSALQALCNSLEEEVNLLAPFTPTPVVKVKPVKVPTTGVKHSTAYLQETLVQKHTSSTSYNAKLAYAVLTSGKSVTEIASAVGASPRALRDYMYYGVSIPEQIGKNLLRVLGSCNYATLGLKFDCAKTRYSHV